MINCGILKNGAPLLNKEGRLIVCPFADEEKKMEILSCDICGAKFQRITSKCYEIRSHTEARGRFGLDDGRLGWYFVCTRCYQDSPHPSDGKEAQMSKLGAIKSRICAKETPLTPEERKRLQIISSRLEDLGCNHRVEIPPLTFDQEKEQLEAVTSILAEIRGNL